ncbi:hypothetical protein MMC13_006712 [Lambiella insularis]|nr:hypothetical protein [Lambiella insularis]
MVPGSTVLAPVHRYSPVLPSPLVNSASRSRETRPIYGGLNASHDVRALTDFRSDPSQALSEQQFNLGTRFLETTSRTNAIVQERNQLHDDNRLRSSPENCPWEEESLTSQVGSDIPAEGDLTRVPPSGQQMHGRIHSQRRPSNRDEFDGPHQFLMMPASDVLAAQEQNLPHLPTNLLVNEQDNILLQVNDCLSNCAFNFVAKYQFPIPLEPDKRPVSTAADREWNEWVFLLKRLATKRRIPARVLYNGQIKQLMTVLENSLEMRHAAKHQSRPLKDDRNVLQLISAGIQVAKILKDASCMKFLDDLYVNTENRIQGRRTISGYPREAVNPFMA